MVWRWIPKVLIGNMHILYFYIIATLNPNSKTWHVLSHVWLCDPMDCSPPDSSVHGFFQASILQWVAISFSKGSSWPRDRTCVSCIGRWILYHWDTWEAMVKNMVYSGINLTEDGQELYIKNYKIVLREFKEILTYSWIGTLNGVKVSLLFRKI